MSKKRMYIAGPITGMKNDNREAFEEVEKNLWAKDTYEPVSPIDNKPQTRNHAPALWEDYMRMGITQLMSCDAIYMLKGWRSSKGATEEHRLAELLGMEIWYESD